MAEDLQSIVWDVARTRFHCHFIRIAGRSSSSEAFLSEENSSSTGLLLMAVHLLVMSRLVV